MVSFGRSYSKEDTRMIYRKLYSLMNYGDYYTYRRLIVLASPKRINGNN